MSILKEEQLVSFLADRISATSGLLIYGDDEAGADEVARMACQKITNGDSAAISHLSGSALGEVSLLDDLNAMSLLGERRVVLVSDVTESQVKQIEPVLAFGSLQNYLILVAGSLTKASKLRGAFEQSKAFVALALYEPSMEVLGRRVANLLKRDGLHFADGAEQVFFEIVGDDRSEVMREAEKLALYCFGSESINVTDVRSACGDTASFSNDELVDAVFSGDIAAADHMSFARQSDGGAERPVLPMLLSHLQRLYELRSAMTKGDSADTVIAQARPPVFYNRRRKFAEQLRILDLDALETLRSSLGAAILQSRQMPGLGAALASRCLLNLAWSVRRAKKS
jgi:DNA polymerase III subunit delta